MLLSAGGVDWTTCQPARWQFARAGEKAVVGGEVVDRAGETDPPAGDEHQVVRDPFELGEDVRGEHDRQTVVRHRGEDRRHEVVAGDWIQRRGWLVEHE